MQVEKKYSVSDPVLESLFEFRLSKGDVKKSQIIIATIDCLTELGIEKTSFGAIAQRVKTQKSHITYYYKSKDDIYMDIYRYIASTYQSYLLRYLEQSKSKKSLLTKYIDAYYDWCEHHPQQVNAMFLLYYFCYQKPQFREINQQIREGGVKRITHLIQRQSVKKITLKKAMGAAWGIQAILAHSAVDKTTFDINQNEKILIEKEARRQIKQLLMFD